MEKGSSEYAGSPAGSSSLRVLSRVPAALVVRVGLLWLIGWFFFVFHGLSFHLTPWSQAIINAIVKYVYEPTGQEDTTVLLFREENLQHLGTSYPIPYDVHGVIFDKLAELKPKSLFVDFVFIDRRDSDDVKTLAAKLRALNAAGTKVFLAIPPNFSKTEHKLACKNGNPLHAYEQLLCEVASPASVVKDDAYGVSGVLTYRKGFGEGQDFVPSAAFALAAENKDSEIKLAEATNLEIIWGKNISDINRKWMVERCAEPSFFRVVRNTLFDGPLATKQTCPYSRSVSVNHLINFPGDNDVAASMHQKAIFYGADFRLPAIGWTRPSTPNCPASICTQWPTTIW